MTSPSAELPSQPDPLLLDYAKAGVPLDAAAEVDRCLDELSQLAQTEISPRDFYAALLDRATRVLAAEGAAAWLAPAGGSSSLLAQIHFPRPLLQGERTWACAASSQPRSALVVPPFARAGARYPCDNPHPWPLAIALLAADARAQVVLEVALDRDAAPEAQQGAGRMLGVIAEIAGDYQRRRELARLRERDARAARFAELVLRLHAGLDVTATAYAIANDGRQWIGCDRVSVLHVQSGRAVTLAASAVEHVDRRSRQILALEDLAAKVAASGEEVAWHEASAQELPPQLEAALQAHLDLGHARQLVALPIRPPAADDAQGTPARSAPHAILIAESFVTDQPLDLLVERSRELASVSRTALGNALAHSSLPLLPLQERMAWAAGALRQRPVAAWLTVAAIAAVVTLLAVLPADFTVEAQGQLQPRVRRNLFAPSDAVVEQVLVAHGDQVAKGDELLRLHSPALDLDRSRLSGELQTAQARLGAVRVARSQPQEASDSDETQLASEEEQLVQQIAGLESQLSVIEQLRTELVLRSPLDGVVLTWNTHQSLDNRPVKQGQVLLSVADTTGAWDIELQVPDADAGHVLAARAGSSEPLPVSFLLASDPAVTHRGQLQHLAQATQATGEGTAAQAIAAAQGPLPSSARAGGRVTARILCGRRSLGYVWLHDVIDFARTTLWF